MALAVAFMVVMDKLMLILLVLVHLPIGLQVEIVVMEAQVTDLLEVVVEPEVLLQ